MKRQRILPKSSFLLVFLAVIITFSNASAMNYVEHKKNRIVVKYHGYPVSVPASKDYINLITVPYPIKFVDTARNIQTIGKSKYEFTIALPRGENKNTDLSIITTKRTFLVTLIPNNQPSTHIILEDTKSKEEEKKASDPVVEITSLIKQAMTEDDIYGYVKSEPNRIFEVDSALVILKKMFMGINYNVVVIEVVNTTKDTTLRLREDSTFVDYILKKLAGNPVATAITREYLEPAGSGRNKSLIYSVVSRD